MKIALKAAGFHLIALIVTIVPGRNV